MARSQAAKASLVLRDSPPQPPGVGYRGRPPKGCVSMLKNDSSNYTPVPWRSVGTVSVSLGAPVGAGILHPLLGETIAVIEIMVMLTVIAVALFGSQALSERAFRLLRWFRNSPGAEGQDQNSMP